MDDIFNVAKETSRYASDGGDGSGGKLTKEIRKKLQSGRKILNSSLGLFQSGDLVYVKNRKEHGIILGQMPESDEEKYLVLTVWREDQKDENPLKYRIRYCYPKQIGLIESSGESREPLYNVLEYCENQCIFHPNCDESCVLKKIYEKLKREKG